MHPLHALDDFLSYIGAERGLSVNTIDSYSRDIRSFLKDVKRLEVSPDQVVTHIAKLNTKGQKSSSIYRAIVALKVFYRYLLREEIIDVNPMQHIDTPKLWNQLPDVLNVDEVDRLLKAAASDLDVAILYVLYCTGIRVSELCQLNVTDVSPDTLRVIGKGRKERIVPIASIAHAAVTKYIKTKKPKEALFLTSRGKRIDRQYVFRMIKKYAARVGISKVISPHTFRHSYATHLLTNGADLRVIQEFLGHADISTTERYTHLSQNELKRSFDTFHPR